MHFQLNKLTEWTVPRKLECMRSDQRIRRISVALAGTSLDEADGEFKGAA